MNVTINGQRQEVPGGTNLQQVLDTLGVKRQFVAVEVNAQLVAREQHADHRLAEGDAIEIVTLVGGG
ncbi:MAG: thiamine biosynthesis protein ThiS [Planctomycetaceae bacterium]|jgi:sulfur carrier protein|nr:thiamine biosynthesis protein ThiS [Planctomycetaceae bacterium]